MSRCIISGYGEKNRRSGRGRVSTRMTTFQRILCPVDLGPGSAAALRYAAALSRVFDAKLFVCHFAEAASDAGGYSNGVAREDMKRLLEDALSASPVVGVDAPPRWEPLVIEGESPAEAIVAEAAAREVDLIVMSSRRRPLRAALMGSTAERVCHSAQCSVFVDHPDERGWFGASSGKAELRRLLVAYDFSPCAEMALGASLWLADRYGAEVHLLHVLPGHAPDTPELRWEGGSAGTIRSNTEDRLQQVVSLEGGSGSVKIIHAVREGAVYHEVLDYAEQKEMDLVLMGAHGAHAHQHLLFGSNVDHVLRRSPCPVFVARPRGFVEARRPHEYAPD